MGPPCPEPAQGRRSEPQRRRGGAGRGGAEWGGAGRGGAAFPHRGSHTVRGAAWTAAPRDGSAAAEAPPPARPRPLQATPTFPFIDHAPPSGHALAALGVPAVGAEPAQRGVAIFTALSPPPGSIPLAAPPSNEKSERGEGGGQTSAGCRLPAPLRFIGCSREGSGRGGARREAHARWRGDAPCVPCALTLRGGDGACECSCGGGGECGAGPGLRLFRPFGSSGRAPASPRGLHFHTSPVAAFPDRASRDRSPVPPPPSGGPRCPGAAPVPA